MLYPWRKLGGAWIKKLDDSETNEVGKELNMDEIDSNLVNNVIPKHEEFGESSIRMRPGYIPMWCATTFPLGSSQGKPHALKKLALPQTTKHASNSNGAHDRAEIFEHWKRHMNSSLNLNIVWFVRNFITITNIVFLTL